LNLGPNKALELGIIDHIILEPAGGAHRNVEEAIELVKDAVLKEINILSKLKSDKLLNLRFEKFRRMGNQTIDFSDGADIKPYL